MSDFLQQWGKELVSVGISVFTWLTQTVFKPKAKLVFGRSHSFTFLVPEQHDAAGQRVAEVQNIYTDSYIVHNIGKQTATVVEILLNWTPQVLNIWPARHYEIRTGVDRRPTLLLDSMAPGEHFGIEMCAFTQLPAIMHVRCNECVGQLVTMLPFVVVPKWRVRLMQFLALAGIALVVYVGIALLQLLVLRTPIGH